MNSKEIHNSGQYNDGFWLKEIAYQLAVMNEQTMPVYKEPFLRTDTVIKPFFGDPDPGY